MHEIFLASGANNNAEDVLLGFYRARQGIERKKEALRSFIALAPRYSSGGVFFS